MSKKVISMKGEEVDFDLLEIKAKMQKADKPLEVKTREDFVHMKRRRRGSANFDDLLKKNTKKAAKEESSSPTADKAKSVKEEVQPTPTPEATSTEVEKTPEVAVKKKKTTAKRKIVKKDDT